MRLFLHFAAVSLFFSALFAENEIRVELTTNSTRSPLYLCRMHSDQAAFEPAYLKNLRKILEFDLNYSGYAKISPLDEILEKALHHNDPNVAFNPTRWQQARAKAVLKPVVSNDKLDLFAFHVEDNSLKKFEGISLTGNLDIDRKQIHKLSDATLKALFGVDGVASSLILYSVQQENKDPMTNEWKGEIYQCDFDGENAKQITYENSYAITPVFIPQSKEKTKDRYLYVNYKTGQPKIYYSSLKNRTGKSLIELRGNQLLPAMNKTRDKIAFISDAAGRADLFIQEVDASGSMVGKPKQLFSYPRSTQASPTFSPDGKKIAFVSDKDGTPRIYMIPSSCEDNKRPIAKLLTKRNRENTCPNWSPDGTKLAYSAKTNGIRQIWLYDFRAEEERQLTTGAGNKENPCWAQNSVHLVFNSTDPGSSELYLVNLHQPEAVKITSGPGKKHYPAWGKK